MPNESEKTPKSKDKDVSKEEKNGGNSFFNRLKSSLTVELPETRGDHKKSSNETPGKASENTQDSPVKGKKAAENDVEGSHDDEDPTQYIIDNFKAHGVVQSLFKSKATIIKLVAVTASIILMIVAILYSITPTEHVASNVIFGERAMFAAFLFLVAFLILGAVFASKLLEGKYLKNIHQELEIVEGKKQKDGDVKSNHDPIVERMNKKDK